MQRIKRHIRSYITFILKIDLPVVKNPNGFSNLLHPFTNGVTKCRIGQKRGTRLEAELTGKTSRCFSNICEIFRRWQLGNIRIRNE